jgi:hypothetical protein
MQGIKKERKKDLIYIFSYRTSLKKYHKPADKINMRGRKTPAVALITHLIQTTSRPQLIKLLYESPLKPCDIKLILDYANGKSYKELAAQNHKSIQRINQQKRKAYEQLARYISLKSYIFVFFVMFRFFRYHSYLFVSIR